MPGKTKSDTTEQVGFVDLNEKQAELEAREHALNEKETELEAKEESLNEKETELEAKEESLNEKETELEAREQALNEKETKSTKNYEPAKGLEFDFRGQSYKFADNTPERIRVMGEVMTQKQIAKDEEVLVHLIGGNSGLIVKTYKNGK